MVSYILILICTVLFWLSFVCGMRDNKSWLDTAWFLATLGLFIQTMTMIYDTAFLIVKGW